VCVYVYVCVCVNDTERRLNAGCMMYDGMLFVYSLRWDFMFMDQNSKGMQNFSTHTHTHARTFTHIHTYTHE